MATAATVRLNVVCEPGDACRAATASRLAPPLPADPRNHLGHDAGVDGHESGRTLAAQGHPGQRRRQPSSPVMDRVAVPVGGRHHQDPHCRGGWHRHGRDRGGERRRFLRRQLFDGEAGAKHRERSARPPLSPLTGTVARLLRPQPGRHHPQHTHHRRSNDSEFPVNLYPQHLHRRPDARCDDRCDVLAALGFRSNRARGDAAADHLPGARQQGDQNGRQGRAHSPVRPTLHAAGRPSVDRGGAGVLPRGLRRPSSPESQHGHCDGMAQDATAVGDAFAGGQPGDRGVHGPGAVAGRSAHPGGDDDCGRTDRVPGLPRAVFPTGTRALSNDQHARPGFGGISASHCGV